MPRRALSRRTFGVLAAALFVAVAAALSPRGPGDGVARGVRAAAAGAVRERCSPACARSCRRSCSTAPRRARSTSTSSRTRSTTSTRPNLSATFRWPLPGQTPNSPMVTEFFAGGFVLGKAENLQGRSRPGNVVVVVWAFNKPEGAYRSLRALRDLSGLHSAPSAFAPGRVAALAAGHGRERPPLGARARARARDLGRRVRAAPRCCARASRWRVRSTPRSSAEPFIAALLGSRRSQRPDLTTLAGRLSSLRIAENDLPGGLDTESWRVRAQPDAARPPARRRRPRRSSAAASTRSACAAVRRR